MPIPHLIVKHKDDAPPPAPEALTREQQRKVFYKTNRWVIVGSISFFLALIGIGYTIFFVIRLINAQGDDVSSVQDTKNVAADERRTGRGSDDSWISKSLPDSKLFAYLPLLSGEHRYLVLLQNSTELRPTGGFIGNLATIKTRDDTLVEYQTFDSYAVDAANGSPTSQQYPVAPASIKSYLKQDRLFLRDANWFPDFRDSAQLVSALYPIGSSDNYSFDAIFAVNPSVVAESIGLLGPIAVDGIEFTQENFVEALEYEVEINAPIYRGKSVSERKEIVNTLFHELITRITALPKKQQLAFAKLAERKLAEKEIQLYFRDPTLQQATEQLAYGGTFKPCPSDCLAVVDANLRALKTDALISRAITYSVREHRGEVSAKLILSYSNKGYYDWKTTDYRSFTRVYMPKHSRNVMVKYLDNELRIYKPLTIDEQGEYRDRSYVGFFHITKVKTTGEVVVEYELPIAVSNSIQKNEYSFVLTKQSGTYPDVTITADFETPIIETGPIKDSIDNGNVMITTKLISDLQLDLKI